MKTIAFATRSDVGMVRTENQDFMGIFPGETEDISTPHGVLFVVADGMGGHNAGREASQLAVNILSESYLHGPPNELIPDRLVKAFDEANEHIFNFSTNNPRYNGMGTTCSALVLQGNNAYIGHIGDSRIYHLQKRRMVQLTKDHSKVAEMVRRGLLTAEEARIHPERSHLYRALGTRPTVEVDILADITLNGEGVFVMCTDGLYNHVEDGEIQQMVLEASPEEACTRLLDLANSRGGQDNITILVIRIAGEETVLTKILGFGKHKSSA